MSEASIVPRSLLASISIDSPAERVADVWNRWQSIKRQIAAADEGVKDSIIEWCRKNGDLEVGEGNRLYVGPKKETRCLNPAAALEALIDATGGDITAVAEALAAQPFKNAAAAKLIGPAASDLWVTEEVPDVKTGKAKRELKQVNERFLRKAG